MCTVRELLGESVLPGARVAAGARGLARTVRGVRMCCSPSSVRSARSGDLVLVHLSPGLPVPLDQWLPFLTALPVSGLCVKPPLAGASDLAPLTARAEAMGLPLLVVDTHSDWLDTIEHVHRQLVSRRVISGPHPAYSLLLDVIRSDGIHGLVETLGMVLELPILYLGPDWKLEGSWGESALPVAVPRLMADLRRLLDPEAMVQPQALRVRDVGGWAVPVTIGKGFGGILTIWETTRPVRPQHVDLLMFAAQLVDSELSAPDRAAYMDGYWRKIYLTDLLLGRPRPGAAGRSGPALLGVAESCSFVVVQVAVVSDDGVVGDEFVARALSNAAAAVEVSLRIRTLSAGWPGNHFVILTLDPDASEQQVATAKQRAVKLLEQHLRGRIGGATFRLGVSAPVSHLDQLVEARHQAGRALALGQHTQGFDCVHEYMALGAVCLLDGISDRQQLATFATRLLGKLEQYDREHSSNLLATLERFFAQNGDRRAVAADLFVHPNTVSYRLHEVERITRQSLARSEDRFNLQLALKIRCYFPQ